MVDRDANGMTAVDEPPTERAAAEPPAAPPRREHPIRDAVLQLVIITAGVLIALFFEGLVGWNRDRALVREARTMIVREIANNKKEVDGELATLNDRVENLENAVRMANELLETKTSGVRQLKLAVSLAELQDVSWRTAERTGALAQMDYGEVQEYSRLYDFQEIYTAHQRRAMEQLASALSLVTSGDPHRAPPRELESFRQRILALRGGMLVEEQFLTRLSELCGKVLEQRPDGQDGSTNPTAR